jgi:hypothetical protein
MQTVCTPNPEYPLTFLSVKITGRYSRLDNDRLLRMEWMANILTRSDKAMKIILAQELVHFSESMARS